MKMELKISETTDEPLLSRKKITAEGSAEGPTPSGKEVHEAITKAAKADGKLVVIKKIRTYFGLRRLKVTAYVYNNEEEMKRIERIKEETKEEKAEEEPKEGKEDGKEEGS